jgi:protoheme IX farnesyltransferase
MMMTTENRVIKNRPIFYLFVANLFSVFMYLISVLTLRNLNLEAYCFTNDCASMLFGKVQIEGLLNNSRAIMPVMFLVISAAIMAYGQLTRSVWSRARNWGIVLILVTTSHLVLQFANQLPQNALDSVYYIFGLVEISLATLWFLAFLFQKKNQTSGAKFSVYDLWAFSALVLIAGGVYISISGTSSQCAGFPICADLLNLNFAGWIVFAHRIVTLAVALLTLIVLNKTWLYFRSSKLMLTSTTMAFALFVGQVLIGGLQVVREFPIDLVAIHAISAALFYITLIVSVLSSKFEVPSETAERSTIFNDRQRLADFYRLNKPIIVLLLLVTTYAGMIVGLGKIPGFAITIWTIIAGALAAGGSSAINQYIDREIDLSMQRTARRPLPSGRLQPAEALALGIVEIVFSFYIYAGFVNLLAAILAMLGMVYYVFIYSLWLKKATVQNIVIGGGAGAIPPLVGWAAATGSLNIPSLFLFGLIFLWTPPHFWALAIVRKNDYARASVPMLPVIKGERNTRLQILIYTVQMVVLTILMPVFDLGGSIFLISAIVLGLWMLFTAWQVFTKAGNKVAYKMYRYSSMYLAFIFLALAIDALVAV